MTSQNDFESVAIGLGSCRRKFLDEAVGVYQTKFDSTAMCSLRLALFSFPNQSEHEDSDLAIAISSNSAAENNPIR